MLGKFIRYIIDEVHEVSTSGTQYRHVLGKAGIYRPHGVGLAVFSATIPLHDEQRLHRLLAFHPEVIRAPTTRPELAFEVWWPCIVCPTPAKCFTSSLV